jgi:outer membrane protein assembly factor BamA
MKLIFAALIFLFSVTAWSQTEYLVTDIQIQGANRTNISWLKNYLGYTLPAKISQEDLERIKKKLLSTMVFSAVEVGFVPVPTSPNQHVLFILIEEKWTTIPVIRGAYGGGTPFRVLGIYDIHTFGRLWTVGAETHQYGSAPMGGVVWARAPKLMQGRYEFGLEYWRQYRERSIYDDEDEKIGSLQSSWLAVRTFYLAPLRQANSLFDSNLKGGVDLRFRNESPNRYQANNDNVTQKSPTGISIHRKPIQQFSLLGRIVQDNMQVNNVLMDGIRMIGSAGPLVEGDKIFGNAEFEGFYFLQALATWNFAVHYFVGQTTSESLESQYFLGGLESVRGIPDGALYGNRAAYTNLELRNVMVKMKYCWIQPILFLDVGGAGQRWGDLSESARSSVGTGVRLITPQIHRFGVRIDYGWSIDQPGTSGLTIGMNQFFDPYKPL